MLRVLFFLVLVALLALGAAWLADRPGEVMVTWFGYRIETSVMVAAVAITMLVAVAIMLWSVLRFILRSPDLIALFLSHRRGVRGYLAVSRGLIAIGAGDVRAARKAADEVERIAPGEPLALLLNAQCAQLSGDRATAELAFRSMAERDDTKLLGLRGLYIEARRRDDAVAAKSYAEEAAKAAPSVGWAGQAVLEFRCAEGDWAGALTALDRNSRNGMLNKGEYRRQRAVLLTARAMALEDEDRDRARSFALDAVKLAPDLVPAADLAGRLLAEAGEFKRANRVIEKAWAANPHPDLADTYAHLRLGDAAPERLARVQALAKRAPGDRESALAVARAAIDAREFTTARSALQPFTRQPTQRVAELMAELERSETGDEGRAREWMARALRSLRDPAWTADGFVSDRWLPVSPVTGRLDAFQWKVALAELTDERDVIEVDERPAVAAAPAPAPAATVVEAKPVPASISEARAGREAAAPAASPAPAAPVVPLVHVPDDPGPDSTLDQDPAPEPSSNTRGLGLFK